MNYDCPKFHECRKPVQLCNKKCTEFKKIFSKEIKKEHQQQFDEDLKNYQSKEYH